MDLASLVCFPLRKPWKSERGGGKEEGSGDSEQDVVTSAKIPAEPIRLQQSYDCVIRCMIFSRKTSAPYFTQDKDMFHRFITSLRQRTSLHRSRAKAVHSIVKQHPVQKSPDPSFPPPTFTFSRFSLQEGSGPCETSK